MQHGTQAADSTPAHKKKLLAYKNQSSNLKIKQIPREPESVKIWGNQKKQVTEIWEICSAKRSALCYNFPHENGLHPR